MINPVSGRPTQPSRVFNSIFQYLGLQVRKWFLGNDTEKIEKWHLDFYKWVVMYRANEGNEFDRINQVAASHLLDEPTKIKSIQLFLLREMMSLSGQDSSEFNPQQALRKLGIELTDDETAKYFPFKGQEIELRKIFTSMESIPNEIDRMRLMDSFPRFLVNLENKEILSNLVSSLLGLDKETFNNLASRLAGLDEKTFNNLSLRLAGLDENRFNNLVSRLAVLDNNQFKQIAKTFNNLRVDQLRKFIDFSSSVSNIDEGYRCEAWKIYGLLRCQNIPGNEIIADPTKLSQLTKYENTNVLQEIANLIDIQGWYNLCDLLIGDQVSFNIEEWFSSLQLYDKRIEQAASVFDKDIHWRTQNPELWKGIIKIIPRLINLSEEDFISTINWLYSAKKFFDFVDFLQNIIMVLKKIETSMESSNYFLELIKKMKNDPQINFNETVRLLFILPQEQCETAIQTLLTKDADKWLSYLQSLTRT